ncbi:MAG: hypothetical protein ACPIOQ_43345, partial [Promethearchaeia archaeon]
MKEAPAASSSSALPPGEQRAASGLSKAFHPRCRASPPRPVPAPLWRAAALPHLLCLSSLLLPAASAGFKSCVATAVKNSESARQKFTHFSGCFSLHFTCA